MTISNRRVRAVVRKELREFRRNRSLVWGMAIFPLIFLVQPMVVVFGLPSSSAGLISREHVLLYMLGIPALVPVVIASHGVVGERQQGTLEPALTTPIRRDEFVLAKALAALLPSLVIAYAVYAFFLVCVELGAQPGVASALIRGPDLIAQVLFTPILALCSIWIGLVFSVRSSDARVAQQLGVLSSLPAVFIAVLVATDIITPTPGLALAAAAALVIADVLGWRVVSAMFDRERLITGTKS